MDLNKVMIIGRLTRDPEARSTPQGQNVSSFSIATNQTWTDSSGQRQEKVEYHNIVAWRKLADICNQYLKKGSKAFIEGRLQTRSWQDQSGNTKYRTEIVADNLIMLDSKSSNTGQGMDQTNTQMNPGEMDTPFEQMNQSAPAQIDNATQNLNKPQEEEIKIEDIPF